MRILIFTENYYAGGMDTFIVNLINEWPSNDEFVIVCNHNHPGINVIEKRLVRPCKIIKHKILTQREFASIFRKRNITKIIWMLFLFLGQQLLLMYYVIRFYIQIREISPDFVLISSGSYPGGSTTRAVALTGLLKQSWGKPIFVYHNDPLKPNWLTFFQEFLIDYLLENSISYLVTVSYHTQGQLKNRLALASSPKKKVIYNGIEPMNLTGCPEYLIRKELELSENSFILLMLATYEPRKGHTFLLQSFKKVLKAIGEVHLIIAGDGTTDEVGRVRSILDDSGLTTNVHLLGFRNDAFNLLSQADILVVPSQSYESFGLTIIEAMSQEIPVVATHVGGIPEVLQNGIGGYTVALDVDLFADKIIELLKDKSLREKVGKAGLKSFNNRFHAKRMAMEYFTLCMQIQIDS
ncbi:MAG: glycosyltransferase family 4 protein [Nitrospirae bacterium]|nr:glycosyltransferase family 4 protein [Nitrospirota bacterium]